MRWSGELAPTILGVLVLVAITTIVLWGYRVPHRWAPAAAILRGALQLALISVVLARVISDPLWVAVALVVMFAVAASTATRRIGWSIRHGMLMAAAMASGIAVTLVVV